MVGIECKVGRYFICSVCHLNIVSAAPSSICLLLANSRRLRTNGDIGNGQGNLRRERQRERLYRDIYTFEKVIEEGHIFKIMSTQHISDWNVRLFPSGP